jgi:hypothetical protein
MLIPALNNTKKINLKQAITLMEFNRRHSEYGLPAVAARQDSAAKMAGLESKAETRPGAPARLAPRYRKW